MQLTYLFVPPIFPPKTVVTVLTLDNTTCEHLVNTFVLLIQKKQCGEVLSTLEGVISVISSDLLSLVSCYLFFMYCKLCTSWELNLNLLYS